MYYVIVNDAHLRGKNVKKLDKVKEVFVRADKEYEILKTTRPGHAKELAESITSDGGEHTIVAMGGDGTLHEILNGFRDFGKCALGLITLGTGNDFASCAHIPRDPTKAAEIIAYGKPRKIDFIELENGLRSINAVGTGLDVEVLRYAYGGKRRGKSKYFFALLKALKTFKGREYTVICDGREFSSYGFIAAAGNGRQIGGGIKLFPSADISDGKMNVICVDFLSRAKMAGAFLKLMRGRPDKIKGARYMTAQECEIRQNGSYTLQAEGELYDDIPFKARIVAGQLNFYLP